MVLNTHIQLVPSEVDKALVEAQMSCFPKCKPCQQHTWEENSSEGEVTPQAERPVTLGTDSDFSQQCLTVMSFVIAGNDVDGLTYVSANRELKCRWVKAD